jgi:hypothetical protein
MKNLEVNKYVFFTDLRDKNLYRITEIDGDTATLFFTQKCKLSELTLATNDQLIDAGYIPKFSAKCRSFNHDMGWS